MSRTPWKAAPDRHVPDDVARLLATVPQWFGQPDSNAEYIEAARTKETWTVRDDDGSVVGVTLIDRRFPHVAEIHLAVVDRLMHGRGVGTAMVEAIEEDARRRGVRLLEVKTLGPSHPDQGYARTRHFYEKWGFQPLEETDLWGRRHTVPDHGEAARHVLAVRHKGSCGQRSCRVVRLGQEPRRCRACIG